MGRLVALLSAALVAGCASEPAADYSAQAQQAKVAGEPVFIYAAPFVAFPGASEVGVINTSASAIQQVSLEVTDCSGTATWTLHLEGRLEPGDGKALPVMSADWVTGAVPRSKHVSHPPRPLKVNRVIITAVDVSRADGATDHMTAGLKQLIDDKIANYCPARMNNQKISSDDFVD